MPFADWDDNFKNVQRKQPFVPNIKHYVASDNAGIYLVAENLGVYIISKLQALLLPPNVVAKELEGNFHRSVGISFGSLKYAKPALKEFINIANHFSTTII